MDADGPALVQALPARAHWPTASSSTSTSRARTAWCSAARCSSRGCSSAASSRARRPADADVVCPVPDSGMGAALGFSQESGLPFEWGLIRNHYVGRTFIQPRQGQRSAGVKIKLNPVRQVIEGRRVVLIDDSIVRGTTSRKIVRMVREAGAREVHLRISSPPTTGPCYYGIDTPLKSELIASSHDGRGDPPLRRGRQPRLPLARGAAGGGGRRAGPPPLHRLLLAAATRGRHPARRVAAAPVREGEGLSRSGCRACCRVGHVCHDRAPGGDVVGGSVTYGSLDRAAARLGGGDPLERRAGLRSRARAAGRRGVPAAVGGDDALRERVRRGRHAAADGHGARRRHPLRGAARGVARARRAAARAAGRRARRASVRARSRPSCVGAIAQGYVRAIDADGRVSAKGWERPERDLLGRARAVPLASTTCPTPTRAPASCSRCVPIVALTRGWRGLTLLTRDGVHDVPSLPRPEKDPTGAGDVFAAAFLVRYQETVDPLEAAAFAACAASCAVEGVGASTLGDRAEVDAPDGPAQQHDRRRESGKKSSSAGQTPWLVRVAVLLIRLSAGALTMNARVTRPAAPRFCVAVRISAAESAQAPGEEAPAPAKPAAAPAPRRGSRHRGRRRDREGQLHDPPAARDRAASTRRSS